MSSDDEVVTRAKAGDQSAWAELYGANAGRLKAWVDTLGVGADAEDLAAEAWLTAARKIASFRGTSSDFAGWLFGIARNLALNSRRRTTRRATTSVPTIEDTLVLEVVNDPAYDIAGRDRVRLLLAQLPRREAEVIACIDIAGLDIASTARALDVSQVAVRVARHRGLGRLRDLLPMPE